MSTERTPFEPAIDPHTHQFPERLMDAIRGSLTEETGWEFDHPVTRAGIEEILAAAGVERYVALPYVHEAGMAADLNTWLCKQATGSERLLPFATVHPEDENTKQIVRDAFESGARGLKFHCPVQECAPADPRIEPALSVAAEYNAPITYHGGTAPMFEDNPYVGADLFEELLDSYPEIRVCCAHMGTYETDRFIEFAREYDNAYLDTTFAMSTRAEETMSFEPASIPDERLIELSESIMYGSDLPNIPYPYREERAGLLARDLEKETYRDLFYRTAAEYLGLDE
ncbi:amidohydrolase family protein [Halovenus rubra]|uniref:Amidohydrolase family protein n=2 Tax=Halovenus rubra TaxID=869890 RepID=A0ACC7E277_9EURY|nr:amidohydrolase family protein [Halovenus rubra]